MKRVGYLFDQIVDPDNIRLAFWKAQRGKSGKVAIQKFRQNLDAHLAEIRSAFLTGDVKLGNYTYFPVFDPKERMICAAAFRERVMQHAVMNVCEPFFEERQIYDSFACRKGKGLDACLKRTVEFSRRHGWHLKMDIHKYFDSIPHDRLKALLRRYFKDGFLLGFFDAIIDSYQKTPRRGIPIGNLTSQYFANAYLGVLDHHIKEVLRVKGYVRYMDDFVVFANNRDDLKALREAIFRFCEGVQELELNEPCMNACRAGLRFLGYVVRPDSIRLSLRAKRRFRAKLAIADRDEDPVKAQALVAFTERADAIGFRRKVIFGSSAEGAYRVNRGGSWNNNARNCRSANRDRNEPGYRNNNLGFRVALAPSSRTRRMPFGEQADDPVALRKGDKTNRSHGLVGGVDAPVERPPGPSLRMENGEWKMNGEDKAMSQINTFFVPLSDGGCFQDELNAFLRGHRVLQVEKAFAGNGWAFCVEWLEGAAVAGRPPYRSRIDYREVLDEAAFARFAKLRERRKAIAQEDGVPPYMVMTDAQMAEAVKDGEPSLEVLKKIDGFGDARLSKYGERLCGSAEPREVSI